MLHSSSNRHRRRGSEELAEGDFERRDWQLWSLALLLIMALTSSIVVTRSPELAVEGSQLKSQLDMYLLSLCVLAMLFCAYAIQSVSALRASRRRLTEIKRTKEELRSLGDATEPGSLAAVVSGVHRRPASAVSGTSFRGVDPERAADQVA